MNIRSNFSEEKILTIFLEGAIDSVTAPEAEAKIMEIYNAHSANSVVLDAQELRYISSSGLRVLLKLRKLEKNLELINASPEVFDILEMTGFAELFPVTQAYRTLNLDDCKLLGEGGHGRVYRINDDTIVKMYYTGDSVEDIKREQDYSKKAFVMGIPTAIPFDIVKNNDMYGLVFELVNADLVSNYMNENPDELENVAKKYANTMKHLHSTHVAEGALSSTKDLYRERIEGLRPYMTDEEVDTLHRINDAIPECDTVVHGDFHPKNVMIQNGEPLLIDMDTLCMGHPVFELGSMFNAFVGYSELDHRVTVNFFGYTHETAGKFWDMSLKMYLGTDDEDVCRAVAEKAMIIGYTRMLRRAIRRPDEADSPAKIARCKEMLVSLLDKVNELTF